MLALRAHAMTKHLGQSATCHLSQLRPGTIPAKVASKANEQVPTGSCVTGTCHAAGLQPVSSRAQPLRPCMPLLVQLLSTYQVDISKHLTLCLYLPHGKRSF